MKINKNLSLLFAIFVGVILFFPSHSLAAAFGVSPSQIKNFNVKAGDHFVELINLSASDFPKPMSLRFHFYGDEHLEKWIHIVDKDTLIMNKGKSIVPMSIEISIPKDADLGEYEGYLSVKLYSDDIKANNIAILLGSRIHIQLHVIDYDVTDYKIQGISVDPVSEGGVAHLNMTLDNLGNTLISDLPFKISIVDKKTDENLFSSTLSKLDTVVNPYEAKKTSLSFSVPNISVGNYWINIESDKSVLSHKNLSLVVQSIDDYNLSKNKIEDEKSNSTEKKVNFFTLSIINTLTVVFAVFVLFGIFIKVYFSLKKKKH